MVRKTDHFPIDCSINLILTILGRHIIKPMQNVVAMNESSGKKR